MPEHHVLVVDDNPSMRKLLGMVLRQMEGVRAEFAGNGLEAAAMHSLNHYDVIILDNAMPEMTGVNFLRTYRDSLEASDTSVIMVTAAPDEDIVRAARNAEIRLHDLVVKPFDIKMMTERVRKMLDRHATPGRKSRHRFGRPAPTSSAEFSPNLSGRMLSLGISVSRTVATASMTGMLMNEDKSLINSFVQSLPKIPGDTLVLDVSGVVGIDEFGLGALLFINGMAASVRKKVYLLAEASLVWERIRSVGIPDIVSMFEQSDFGLTVAGTAAG